MYGKAEQRQMGKCFGGKRSKYAIATADELCAAALSSLLSYWPHRLMRMQMHLFVPSGRRRRDANLFSSLASSLSIERLQQQVAREVCFARKWESVELC